MPHRVHDARSPQSGEQRAGAAHRDGLDRPGRCATCWSRPQRSDDQRGELLACFFVQWGVIEQQAVPEHAVDDVDEQIEILGRAYSEGDLLKIAYSYEQATLHRRPPWTTPPLPGEP